MPDEVDSLSKAISAISEARKHILSARQILDTGPTSGKSRRIWVEEADNELAKAERAISEFTVPT